ncbi:MAG: UvrD-helicase domain-containing protein [Bacteroidetes bacterium]|nr:UvrD-helicase domain-containing protein [Bacteroidota bacterium]
MSRLNIIKASAGSGKTYTLAYNYVKMLIMNPYSYRNILAVTFTNKATAEMKQRILDELDVLANNKSNSYLSKLQAELSLSDRVILKHAKEAQELILHDYSRFSVITIDKFFVKILKSFERELGLESDSTINLDAEYFVSLSVDRLLEQMNNDEKLKQWIVAMVEDEEGTDIRKTMLGVAKHILDVEYEPMSDASDAESLKLIYKSITEKEEIIKNNLIGKAKLFFEEAQKGGFEKKDFLSGIYNYVISFVDGNFKKPSANCHKAIDKDKIGSSKSTVDDNPIFLESFSEMIDIWQENSRFLNAYKLLNVNFRSFVMLADVYSYFLEVCKENNVMLLAHSIRLISKLINDNDAPFIYEKMGSRYDYFMIDEFQDTSSQQWRNFVPLLNNALSQGEENEDSVSLVGDVKQSIYYWRGGDWRIFEGGISENIDPEYITEHNLDTNYRSQRNVVEFNNMFFEKSNEIFLSTIEGDFVEKGVPEEYYSTIIDAFRRSYGDVSQKVPQGKDDSGYVEVAKCDFKEEENLGRMVQTIEDLQDRGYSPTDIAILVRTNREAESVVSYIMQYKNSQPLDSPYSYDIISEKGLLLVNAPVLRFVISVMNMVVMPNELDRAIYNNYLNKELKNREPLEDVWLWDKIRQLPILEIYELLLQHYNLSDKDENIAYLQAFHSTIISFTAQYTPTLTNFLEWWERYGIKQTVVLPDEQQAIRVETIHKSKGLQYGVVIIPFCNWVTYRSNNSKMWVNTDEKPLNELGKIIIKEVSLLGESSYDQQYQQKVLMTKMESFNMLYVAYTRAKNEMYIFVENGDNKNVVANMSVLLKYTMSKIIQEGDKYPKLIDNDTVLSYGKKLIQDKKEKKLEPLNEYHSLDYHSKIALRLSDERYIVPEIESVGLNPRDYGVLMHKVFEELGSIEELPGRINQMTLDGELTNSEHKELLEALDRVMQDELIASWFDKRWQVRNESAILVPTEGVVKSFSVFKPDRVMMDGDEAIVVDYKFGLNDSPKYLKQVNNYVNLLRDMGFKNVKGYLWFVQKGRIDIVL